MNETIKQLQDRRSVREFTGENIKEKDLQAILYTAQRAANSVNGQQTSLIVIRDKQKLEKIAELCGGQKHIAEASVFVFVVMDFYRGVYAAEKVKEGVEFHEKDINKWRKENGTPQLPSYKEMIVRIYENFYNESKKELEEQGFKFADKMEEE